MTNDPSVVVPTPSGQLPPFHPKCRVIHPGKVMNHIARLYNAGEREKARELNAALGNAMLGLVTGNVEGRKQ